MPDSIEKLRPDRDLQCYFERPSAIAALSQTGPSGFTVSGSWRQQFDWAVVEWNRDNVIEHPMFRYLPDGNLSGLTLTYEETRSNCIPLSSDLYPTVDWPYLRIWAISAGVETLYKVRMKDYAVPIQGAYQPATAQLQILGTPTVDDYLTLAWLTEHHTYQLYATDTLETAAQALVDSINAFSTTAAATRAGSTITITYAGAGQTPANSTTGANGNRIGVRSLVAGATTENWSPATQLFSGGTSPTKWRITLNFASLVDIDGRAVPTSSVRKMRWTYSADLQSGAYQRSDFSAQVSNWSVTGANRVYSIAGPGSRRIEDDSKVLTYTGSWSSAIGNYSGGRIRHTSVPGASMTCSYSSPQTHSLYLGTRMTLSAPPVSITVDGQARTENLNLPDEDVLVRLPLGQLGPGNHTITLTHAGAAGSVLYFDFVEMAIPTTTLPTPAPSAKLTLATDWDTDHSIAIAPERTAWMIHSLGFRGRANHYVGALWFYEIFRTGHQYASGTVDFSGTPQFSQTTQITIGRQGQPPSSDAVIPHVNLMGDTAETIAKAFELELNRGYTAVRAEAQGARLTVYARQMGAGGNTITLAATPTSGGFVAQVSAPTLTGGVDGDWRTDLISDPRLNRAAADWTVSFAAALKNYGTDVAAAFSMELQHGDPSLAAGIAQRYPSGNPVTLTTPALQTNFSPASLSFWKKVYLEMAALLAQAGNVPYLQFGEVQWWYFPYDGSGMPFYDPYTTATFQSTYGRPMHVITSNNADPALHPEECVFLPQLIGSFTNQVMAHVRLTYPNCRFEVLYPTDVNDTSFNRIINYPLSSWTPAALDNLKTESFTYTFERNVDKGRSTILHGETLGFPNTKRSFLVGIGDSIAPWRREVSIAQAEGLESVVLFALDQFCLIGYPPGLEKRSRRSVRLG